ncbi:MAG: hypothetical protein WCP60_10595 [bacterium]
MKTLCTIIAGIFFVLYWGWMAVNMMHFFGNWGAILCFILTPVGATPVVLLLQLFHADWQGVGMTFLLMLPIAIFAMLAAWFDRRTS